MARPAGKKDTKKRVRKKLNPKEKKTTVSFQVKSKQVKKAKKIIQPIVDKLNQS